VVSVGKTAAVSVSIPRKGTVCEIVPNIRNKGTIKAANGIIIEINKILNTISFDLLLKISNPYPANEEINNARIVVEIEILAELTNAGTRFTVFIRLLKFSMRLPPGKSLPFVTSTDLFVALTTIHRKGKMEIIVAKISIP
jgi:hypothetical protein